MVLVCSDVCSYVLLLLLICSVFVLISCVIGSVFVHIILCINVLCLCLFLYICFALTDVQYIYFAFADVFDFVIGFCLPAFGLYFFFLFFFFDFGHFAFAGLSPGDSIWIGLSAGFGESCLTLGF